MFNPVINQYVTNGFLLKSGNGVHENPPNPITVEFKSNLMSDDTYKENEIYRKSFTKTRPKNTSIMAAIAYFNQLIMQIIGQDASEILITKKLPIHFFNTDFPCFLDLGDSTMERFHRRLEKILDENINHDTRMVTNGIKF